MIGTGRGSCFASFSAAARGMGRVPSCHAWTVDRPQLTSSAIIPSDSSASMHARRDGVKARARPAAIFAPFERVPDSTAGTMGRILLRSPLECKSSRRDSSSISAWAWTTRARAAAISRRISSAVKASTLPQRSRRRNETAHHHVLGVCGLANSRGRPRPAAGTCFRSETASEVWLGIRERVVVNAGAGHLPTWFRSDKRFLHLARREQMPCSSRHRSRRIRHCRARARGQRSPLPVSRTSRAQRTLRSPSS